MYKSNEEYLNNPSCCPYCGSEDLEGDYVDIECGRASQVVSCLTCGAEWVDLYQLEKYIPIKAMPR